MRAHATLVKIAAFAVVIAGVALTTAYGKRPGGGGSGCPRDILCADIYDPVICSDGVIYGNACYAFRECATGCVPYGDGGPVEAASGFRVCPRDINCPDVYDPVTCSNGVTYPNACYAFRACATGCGSGGT
jgi:hypothetical protein